MLNLNGLQYQELAQSQRIGFFVKLGIEGEIRSQTLSIADEDFSILFRFSLVIPMALLVLSIGILCFWCFSIESFISFDTINVSSLNLSHLRIGDYASAVRSISVRIFSGVSLNSSKLSMSKRTQQVLDHQVSTLIFGNCF